MLLLFHVCNCCYICVIIFSKRLLLQRIEVFVHHLSILQFLKFLVDDRKRKCLLIYYVDCFRHGHCLRENIRKELTSRIPPRGKPDYAVLLIKAMTLMSQWKEANWTSQSPIKSTESFQRKPKKVSVHKYHLSKMQCSFGDSCIDRCNKVRILCRATHILHLQIQYTAAFQKASHIVYSLLACFFHIHMHHCS